MYLVCKFCVVSHCETSYFSSTLFPQSSGEPEQRANQTTRTRVGAKLDTDPHREPKESKEVHPQRRDSNPAPRANNSLLTQPLAPTLSIPTSTLLWVLIFNVPPSLSPYKLNPLTSAVRMHLSPAPAGLSSPVPHSPTCRPGLGVLEGAPGGVWDRLSGNVA